MSHITTSAAFSTRLATLGFPVAYENADFTPPAEVYLAESILPAETRSSGLAATSSDICEGVWQVLCYAPAGEGKGAAFNAAKQVLELFPKALRAQHSGLEATVRRAEQNAGFPSGARWVVPISVYYRATS